MKNYDEIMGEIFTSNGLKEYEGFFNSKRENLEEAKLIIHQDNKTYLLTTRGQLTPSYSFCKTKMEITKIYEDTIIGTATLLFIINPETNETKPTDIFKTFVMKKENDTWKFENFPNLF